MSCLPVVLVCSRLMLHLISPFCRAPKVSPSEALLSNVQPEPLNLQFLSGTPENLSLLGKPLLILVAGFLLCFSALSELPARQEIPGSRDSLQIMILNGCH